MATYESLFKDLAIQERIEGKSENIELCRIIVKHLKTNMDIQAFFNIKFHRYDKYSYQAHKFYYVKDNIKALFAEILSEKAEIQA